MSLLNRRFAAPVDQTDASSSRLGNAVNVTSFAELFLGFPL
jgi:hypothetical protein